LPNYFIIANKQVRINRKTPFFDIFVTLRSAPFASSFPDNAGYYRNNRIRDEKSPDDEYQYQQAGVLKP